MRRVHWIAWLWLVAWLSVGELAGAVSPMRPERLAAFVEKNTVESFRALPLARKILDPANLDHELLSAAIFHETNRRRLEHNLPLFQHHPAVVQAASMQAGEMAGKGYVDHVNRTNPKMKSLADRLKLAGLKPRISAENVAMTFGIRYTSGRTFYIRKESGETIFSDTPDGPPIERHTYLSFADALVEAWMNSPGHRKNILYPEVKFLGCRALPARNKEGMDVFYSCQVFYTPMAEAGK